MPMNFDEDTWVICWLFEPLRTLRRLRTLRTLLTLRTLRTLRTRRALRTLRSLRTLRTLKTLRTLRTPLILYREGNWVNCQGFARPGRRGDT